MVTVESVEGVPIRLTDERIEHIENHLYLDIEAVLDTVYYPEFVLKGKRGSKIAIVNVGYDMWLSVVYKEVSENDGFIITAYKTNKVDLTNILWQR
jgi:hypothetical protein